MQNLTFAFKILVMVETVHLALITNVSISAMKESDKMQIEFI